MQLDFHFYTIYALCRCAGMLPKDAKTVAYASQYTDDAKHDHTLEFKNGGRFSQVQSAHKHFSLGILSRETQYQIYVPFHFMPGNEGDDFYERLLCRENSSLAKQMVREVANIGNKPYKLHRLGIAFHVYADTWSHQEFSGIKHELNEIEDVDSINEEGSFFPDLYEKIRRNVGITVIPEIGHAQCQYYPDIPYAEWTYKKEIDHHERHKKNWGNCLRASKAIYDSLVNFLDKPNNSKHFKDERIQWSTVRPIFDDLFKREGSIEERCQNWAGTIKASKFGFKAKQADKSLSYHDREWFNKAVSVENGTERDLYTRVDNFYMSDWKLFHDAAVSHRFYVLRELLPQYEIICG